MNQQFRHRQFPASSPLANALVVIVGILVISLSLALGFFVFIGIAGFLLSMAAIMSVRAWWLRRRFGEKLADRQAQRPGKTVRHRIIEGEYYEVRTRDETEREP